MSDKKTVIALGYFDSVHMGHRKVMQKAREKAQSLGANLAVFTFNGNLRAAVKGEREKSVYTPYEREQILKELGVKEVYFAPVTKEFLDLSRLEFLDLINEKYDIACYVSGEDYRFGKDGAGDKDFLSEYAKNKGQDYVVCPTEKYRGDKISTTRIKVALFNGMIKEAGEMLGRSYSVTGVVFEDRKVGRKLGFPTVNIKIDREKFKLFNAVYKGRVTFDGVEYKTVINYGARPTYELGEKLIEAHIVGFNGNLYGKEITVYFDKLIRGIKRFSSEEELKIQLEKDVEGVKEGKYD